MTRRLHATLLASCAAVVAVCAGCGGHQTARSAPAAPVATSAADSPPAAPTDPAAAATGLVARLNDPRMDEAAYRSSTLATSLAPSASALAARFAPGPAFEAATHLRADRAAGRATIAEVVALHATVVAHDDTHAVVAVWAVSLVGTTKLGRVVAGWSTDTLTLEWTGDRWLLDTYTSTPGPVPQTAQPPDGAAAAFALLSGSTGANR